MLIFEVKTTSMADYTYKNELIRRQTACRGGRKDKKTWPDQRVGGLQIFLASIGIIHLAE